MFTLMRGTLVNAHRLALTRLEFDAVSAPSFFDPSTVVEARNLGDRMTFVMSYYNVRGKLADCPIGETNFFGVRHSIKKVGISSHLNSKGTRLNSFSEPNAF